MRCWRWGIRCGFNEILSRLDWSAWEAGYDLTKGQLPIHPRVLARVVLYGLLTRSRSSRRLEEALRVRLDFRWLVEGREIDHTTLSTFRKHHPETLKTLFEELVCADRLSADPEFVFSQEVGILTFANKHQSEQGSLRIGFVKISGDSCFKSPF